MGPPWQARENGYVLRSSARSLYVEPHVEFNEAELRCLAPVDAVISPISGQALPGLELVRGVTDALRLMRTLQPRWVMPMANGDIDASGVTAALVRPVGTQAEFARQLLREVSTGRVGSTTQLVTVAPARPVRLGGDQYQL